MATVERPDTALIREAAARLAENRTAKPGMADTRAAVHLALLARPVDGDGVALARDRIEEDTLDAIERRWARQGWLQFATVDGWVAELRSIADFYEKGGVL